MSTGGTHSRLGWLARRPDSGRGDGRPPSERTRGHRGLRGWAALVVAVGVIPTLYVSTRPTGGTIGGSGATGPGPGSLTYSYTLGPSLAFEVGLTALAAALAVASGILWRARRPRSIVGGSLLAAGAAAAAVLLTGIADHHATPPLTAVNALALGTSHAGVLDRLGSPEADAQTTATGPGPTPVCVVYAIGQGATTTLSAVPIPPGEPDWIGPGTDHAVLCFTRGRLSLKAPA
ncbi:MAG TPA: hypothetical protein VG165_00195 [Solirubrobacteraceae bacterium]|jgi:hypothetical protein|nr:hypothetical protein [Solirubrobacteraceae bacterium]